MALHHIGAPRLLSLVRVGEIVSDSAPHVKVAEIGTEPAKLLQSEWLGWREQVCARSGSAHNRHRAKRPRNEPERAASGASDPSTHSFQFRLRVLSGKPFVALLVPLDD